MTRSTKKILIVEDEDTLLEMWEREVEEFNGDDKQSIKFDLKTAKNTYEALDYLTSENFDFLMVDLRLPKVGHDEGDAEEGNNLIKEIITQLPIVTAVNSGHPEEFIKESLGPGVDVQIFTKDNQENIEVLKWFAEQSNVAEALSETFKGLHQILAELFHRSIWPRWREKWSSELSSDDVKSIISRQSAAYIGEVITHTTEQGELHHPEEFYIAPPLRKRLHTGDLVTFKDELFVVLSPQCDMANNCYPAHILLAKCEECTEQTKDNLWQSFYANRASVHKKAKAIDRLRSLLNQDANKSLHFLPPFDGRGPWFVNFKNVMTLPASEVENLIGSRIVSIAPSFIPNLVQRFSSYIGRIGQPNVCPDFTSAEVQRIIDAAS